MQKAEIDPRIATLIDELNEITVGTGEGTPEGQRRDFREMMKVLRSGPTEPFAGIIHDEVVYGPGIAVPVRVYEPGEPTSPRDLVVFFHGGGWVLGDRDTADRTARAIADRMHVTVVSVDYRRAPEHPFPAAFDDCLGVVKMLAQEREPRWLGLAGDSAGGNLAAAVALAGGVADLRVDGQLLFYPALDPDMRAQSHTDFAMGYLLTRAAMEYFWGSYLSESGTIDERVSPAIASDLSGAPPAVVTTAGFDPLLDEGQEYAARLVSAGVPMTYLPFPGLVHGWLDLTDRVPSALAARDLTIAAFDALRLRAVSAMSSR